LFCELANMGKLLTVRYTPHLQDFARALRLFNWQRTSTKAILVFLTIAFGLVLVATIMKGPPLTLFELLWLLFPPLFVIFSFYLQPLQIAKKAAQSEQLMSEATWEVSDSGIQINNSSGTKLLAWESLCKLVIMKDYYLLTSKNNKNAFRFLPRRAFASPQEEKIFVELARQKIPKS
jgi:hypothetical protein